MGMIDLPKLDPREEHFRIPSPLAGLKLFLRRLPAEEPGAGLSPVLYVHGGTFASALSIAYRFDGRSWRDELSAAGFDSWGLDFHGFGSLSDPYPEMGEPAENHPPLGRAEAASRQLEEAVRFICSHLGLPRLSIIAHSWAQSSPGDLPAAVPSWWTGWCSSAPSCSGCGRPNPSGCWPGV